MKSVRRLFVLLLLPLSVFAREKFELKDNDVVAFIGGTFAEREQEDGSIELMLTRHAMAKNVTFRNLGWSGDVISSHLKGSSAAEPRQKYVPDLFSYVAKVKPTVIFVSYGMMESFSGEKALAQFVKDYETVLDKLSETTTRIVLVSPIRHESLGGAWQNPAKHNNELRAYVDAIKKLADKRGLWFVDLFDGMKGSSLTSNGVHLNSNGYVVAAKVIEKQLELGRGAKLTRDAEEQLRSAIKTKNKQFWYFYRPMNSEYVYTGGTRFQDKLGPVQHPMNVELDQFYALAQKDDQVVNELKGDIATGKKIALPEPKIDTESAGKTRPVQRDPSAPDPEEERASFKVADGLNVELFAADPLIAKPIQMAFDARGRLWVATTTRYPQIKPGETQDDKVVILEDKDGDGKADTATVFADNLLIPTGMLPSRGGCYTSDDTKIWFLKDPTKLGHVTDPEIVLSGFGTEDSHHKAHVFRWGPGGNIYFNQGVFLHSVIETAFGIRHLSGNWNPGIWEYDPADGRLEIYLANSVPPNPWGHYWNRWGFDFHIDSSGQGGSYMILPTAGRSSTAVDVRGGEGKLAGAELISGDHVPPDWQGTLISNPFKENRVHHWAFRDEGAGYTLKQLEPLIISTNNAFRPVEIRMGPDGAIYIADWYNPLIGHMQYHFRDPGRDFTHGRIWRITFKDRPLAKRPEFRSIPETLNHLKDSADYDRMQARRVLTESNPKEVLPALAKWVNELDPNDADYDHHRLEALWVYQSQKSVQPELLKSLLRAKEPNARAAATIVLRYWRDQISDTFDLLRTLVVDEHPRVRLEAVIALSYINDARTAELATKVLDQPMDRFLDQALKNTMQALKPYWQSPLQAGQLSFDGSAPRQQYMVQLAGATVAKFPKHVQDAQFLKTLTQSNGNLKPLTQAEIADLVAEVRTKGNPERGEIIFHRQSLSCMQCHAINGAGGLVGPDLGGVGTGSTVDYLIDSVLFPSKIIKDNFETVQVTTKDGEDVIGIEVRENKDELVLKDNTHAEMIIPTATIEKREHRPFSLMPSGLASTLTHAEFIDLIRFLSELGKPGPYANNSASVARRWQVVAPVYKNVVPTSEAGLKWIPAYSHVSGVLPVDELAKTPALARCEVEVTSPGKVQLQVNSTKGLQLWVDNESKPLNTATILDLQKGTHAFTFFIDGQRHEGLRAQFDEVSESSARFHIK
ncbi:MAG: PVC-type heme-binding CxxCH protein [Limisphaerales bacterium]